MAVTNQKPKCIRDSVNGVKKFVRIPVRRKRVPILAKEFDEMLNFQLSNGISNDAVRNRITALDKEGRYEEAGKLVTYLDFINLIEIETASESANQPGK